MTKAFHTLLQFSYTGKLVTISYQTNCILKNRSAREKKLKNIQKRQASKASENESLQRTFLTSQSSLNRDHLQEHKEEVAELSSKHNTSIYREKDRLRKLETC